MGPSFRRHRAPDPGPRSRGGVRPGRVRTGAADLDANRHPRSTRRLADDDRAEPGPGCAAPRVGAAPGAAAARTGRGGARARRRPRRRRPPTAGLHLLSPCLVPRRPGRSHPAAGVRAVDGRGGPCVPGAGVHHGRADHAGQEEDHRRPYPVPRGLARMLHLLMPNDAEISALLALLLLIDARADARLSASGRLLLLSQQDRTCWDTRLIDEGVGLLTDALRRHPPTRYAVEAAIAAVHAEAPTWQDTDWAQIVALYNVLLQLWTPAAVAYQEAMTLTDNDVELAFLSQRLDEVRTHLRT